jgi:hypothetical protein
MLLVGRVKKKEEFNGKEFSKAELPELGHQPRFSSDPA